MAKYVLLNFEDDDAADQFVKDCTDYPDAPILTPVQENEVKAFVRGVWKKPTKFCDCRGGGMKNRGFTRGKKFGWWVCTKCKKPTVGWARGEHWFLALGKNLLPISQRAPEYRGDGIFARHFKACEGCGSTLVTEIGHADTKIWCPTCGRFV